MGVFPPPVPDTIVAPINMISYVDTHLGDPWVIPNPSEVETYGNTMSLSLTKLSYLAIQSEIESIVCSSHENELDQYSLPEWANIPSSSSHDFLSDTLLSDEEILEAMIMSEWTWEDNHHWSSLLPLLIEEELPLQTEASDNGQYQSPSTSYGVSLEGNLRNISKTITIDISVKPDIMEMIMIGANYSLEEVTLYKALFHEFLNIFSWSYEEMPRIDTRIIVHQIKTHVGARLVCKNSSQSTPKRKLLSKQRLKSSSKMVSFIQYLSLNGFQTSCPLQKSKVLFVYVSTIGT